MTEIFEETLDPPTIAAKGLLGTSTAPRRYRDRYRDGERKVRGGEGRGTRCGEEEKIEEVHAEQYEEEEEG
jgi:hypothetical protein